MKKCKLRRILSVLLSVLMIVMAVPMSGVALAAEGTTEFLGGNGTEEDPYLISNKNHLNNVRNHLDAHFKMVSDIEFTEADFAKDGAFYNGGRGWKPIGEDDESVFAGVFDGNYHTITGLHNDYAGTGLFGYNRGTIRSLGIKDGNISTTSTSSTYVGGIAGYNSGTISNCYNTGIVSSSLFHPAIYIGGIAGYNSGTIVNCYNTGNISGSTSGTVVCVGGIAGDNDGIISSCYNAGSILASVSSSKDYVFAYAGGIAGYNSDNAINSCYNTGSVSGSASSSDDDATAYVGGIVGYNYGKGMINNCYNTGNVSGPTSDTAGYFGGIVGYFYGYNRGMIVNCYNTGNISASTGGTVYVGGIVGHFEGNSSGGAINSCYNTGNILDSTFDATAYAGGIAGRNDDTISNCYNTGNILGSTSSSDYDSVTVGGIAGYNSDTISNCYNTGNILGSISSSDYDSVKSGGIAGYNGGTIINCYNTGNISGFTSSSDHDTVTAGGIAGVNYDIISNCYNIGNISDFTSYAGGIAGYNYGGAINSCYNTGDVSVFTSDAGGIVGYNYGKGMISSSYYLDNISKGVGNGDDSTVKCTTEQMKRQSTFVGFDFHTVWEIDGYRDYPYPQLKSNRQEPIQSIELLTRPTNAQTIEGVLPEGIDATVKITYADGLEITTRVTSQMWSELNLNQIGIQTVHLNYGGQTTTDTIDIEVLPKPIASIAVTTLPNKTEYVQGQPLNPGGGALTVYYYDNTSKLIALSEAQLSYPQDQTGIVTATAEYQGVSTHFSVTIREKQVQSIDVIEPEKVSYIEGEALDLTGGKLQITYVSDDNYTERIPLELDMISGYDPNIIGTQTLTVSYEGKQAQFVIRVTAKSLTHIEITKLPDQLIYIEGNAFDPTGGKVTLTYNNGTSEVIDLTADMITGFDNTKVGKQTLTVTYGGFTDSFEVEIVAKELSSIELTTLPSKQTYLEGCDVFDPTGGKVTLIYNNGTSEVIDLTADMITGFDNTKVGKQSLTVTYGGFTDSFEVEIVAKELSSIELTTLPSKQTYLEGCDVFDPTGGKVTLTYNNGTSEVIDLTADMITGFDNTKIGKQTLTVTYGGFTDIFEVEIVAKELSSIELTTLPSRQTYLEGCDVFDPTGGKVTLTYNNGTSKVIDLTANMVTGFDNTKVGKQPLTVTYGGFTDSFEVEIVARVHLGDADGDGIINGKDLLLMEQVVNGWDSTLIAQNADLNGDGKVNAADVLLMYQKINNGDA